MVSAISRPSAFRPVMWYALQRVAYPEISAWMRAPRASALS